MVYWDLIFIVVLICKGCVYRA